MTVKQVKHLQEVTDKAVKLIEHADFLRLDIQNLQIRVQRKDLMNIERILKHHNNLYNTTFTAETLLEYWRRELRQTKAKVKRMRFPTRR